MSEQNAHSYIAISGLNYCEFLKFMCFNEFCECTGSLSTSTEIEVKNHTNGVI